MIVTGRFKTSHLWALFKTSHDVMQVGSLNTTLHSLAAWSTDQVGYGFLFRFS
jgi:hypothetical protein